MARTLARKCRCKGCDFERPYCAKGYCHPCYQAICQAEAQRRRNLTRPKKLCSRCGRERTHVARGLCRPCARTVWADIDPCAHCRKVRVIRSGHRGLCWGCYHRPWVRDGYLGALELRRLKRVGLA